MQAASRLVLIVGLVAGLAAGGPAAAQTVTAAADTYITEHANLGGPTSVHGSDAQLFLIGTPTFQATPLVRFDLSGFAGKVVSGNATFQLFLNGGFQPATQVVEVHRSLSAWNESTTSFANIPGGPPYGAFDVTPLDTETITFNPGGGLGPRFVSWTIPGSVVQSWINSPGSNNGLVLVTKTTPGQQDLIFASREAGLGVAPRLTFAVVPEPASLALALPGVLPLIFALRGRRKRG